MAARPIERIVALIVLYRKRKLFRMIKNSFCKICSLLKQAPVTGLFLAAVSALALAAAFVGQYVFDLQPCAFCIYQRYPFALAALFGIAAAVSTRYTTRGGTWLIGGAGLALLGNSVLALYHSGIERDWWQGPSSCTTATLHEAENLEDAMARIESAPVVPCDEIPWADPVLGLSMANWNVALCAGLALLAFASVWLRQRSS